MAEGNGWIAPEPVRRAKSAVAVVISFAIVLGVIGVASWKVYGLYMDLMQRDDYIGDGDKPVQVVIQPGYGWGQVATALVAKDVVKDPSKFQLAAQLIGTCNPQPGTWNLKTHLPGATAAGMLCNPDNKVVIRLTVKEGTTIAGMFPVFSEALGTTKEEFDAGIAAAQADPSTIGLTLPAGSSLEGFLFPDTYLLNPPIDTDMQSILKQMAAEFNATATSLDLAAQAEAFGLSLAQVVTIASIIEAEVNQDEYRPQVARAIYNRLEQGMPLAVESAFRYGRMMTDGTPYDDPITVSSQHDDTLSYNYYLHAGLPATPIGNPGKQALQAAVNPTDGDWLWWVTVDLDSGETKFASTEDEFIQYRDQFQQWCADHGNPTGCQ